MTGKTRVLVVDDSILARKVLINGLSDDRMIEVVGYAINAVDAKSKVKQLKPDVMTLDVNMPGMFTSSVMTFGFNCFTLFFASTALMA